MTYTHHVDRWPCCWPASLTMYENMDEKMLVLCNDGAVSARWEWCGEVGERQPASRPLLLTGSLGCALATSHGTCLTMSRTMVGRVCGASLLDQPNVTDCCLMLPHPLFAPSPVCTTRRMVGGAGVLCALRGWLR